MFLYNMGAGILRAVGDTLTPLIFMGISVGLNILLTFLFLRFTNLGVRGVAWSTVMSQGVGTVLVLFKLFLTKKDYRVSFKKLRIDKKIFLRILRIGLPVGIHTGIISAAHIVMQGYINGFDKALHCIGHAANEVCMCPTPNATGIAISSKIDGFVYMPMAALSMALTTFVGQNMGANRADRAKKAVWICLVISSAVVVVLGTTARLLAPYFIRLLLGTDTPMYETAFNIGLSQITVLVLSYPLLMLNDIFGSTLRGSGKALIPSIILVVSMFGVRLLFLFFAINVGGMPVLAVYLTFPVSWAFSAICMGTYFLKSNWSKKSLIVDTSVQTKNPAECDCFSGEGFCATESNVEINNQEPSPLPQNEKSD